jgi:phosphopantetheinyl transferase (holo-ACP synthase)
VATIAPSADRHQQGRLAAWRALGRLLGTLDGVGIEPDGGRPVVTGCGPRIALSVTHGRRRAFAVAGEASRLGIDLCDLEHAPRIAAFAPRFLAEERPLLRTPWEHASCFAAKEAGLKALGLGLLDGGLFDRESTTCPVRVLSLSPPCLEPPNLELAFGCSPDGPVAVVWRPW